NGAKPSLKAAAMGNPWSKPLIGCEAAELWHLPAIYGPDQRACKAAFYSRRGFLRLRFSNGRINALVCMFNSFALAGPFCERMKLPRLGDRLPGPLLRQKSTPPWTYRPLGDVQSDG